MKRITNAISKWFNTTPPPPQLPRPELSKGKDKKVKFVVPSCTAYGECGCGKLYTHFCHEEEGKLTEIRTNTCKQIKEGTCLRVWMTGFQELINWGLEAGADIEEAARRLKGNACERPTISRGEKVLSCLDMYSIVIREYLKHKKAAADEKERK